MNLDGDFAIKRVDRENNSLFTPLFRCDIILYHQWSIEGFNMFKDVFRWDT